MVVILLFCFLSHSLPSILTSGTRSRRKSSRASTAAATAEATTNTNVSMPSRARDSHGPVRRGSS